MPTKNNQHSNSTTGLCVGTLLSSIITNQIYIKQLIVAAMFAIIFVATAANATTYYIDFSGGSDTNTGTSKTTPWKRHPYMNGFSGSYSHQAGDRFIFKGGVSWLSSVFPLAISSGGDSSASDYYGVDKSWYVGANWTRPIFDGGGTVNNFRNFVIISSSYVTLDNFDMKNYYWNASTGGYGTAYIIHGNYSYIHITNNYLHGWSHSADAADDLDLLLGNYPPDTGNIFDSNIIDGEIAGADSGMAIHNGAGIISNNIIRNMPNGILPCSERTEIVGNTLGPFNLSFDNRHENAIEPLGGQTTLIYNNVIHGARGVTVFVGQPSVKSYIFNNVIYDDSPINPIPILVDGRGSQTFQAFIFNNTLQHGGANISYVGLNFTIDARNNFLIDGGIDGAATQISNLILTPTDATAAGYTVMNLFSPINSAAPTVGAGSDLSAFCTADQAGPALCKDIHGHARPQGSKWDIGAYQFQNSNAVSLIPPANLRVVQTP
ncbi:MAG: hypothetical protein ACXWRZ_17400 [Bdellovibrio sp.]